MCFVLYAGTSVPIPQKEWCDDVPDISVRPLTERESPIVSSFTKPKVQYIGSTSQCGCDFPHVEYQNGEWPWYEDDDEDEFDRKQKEIERHNREGLVALLRSTGEATIELYGVWDGDFDFTCPPVIREEVQLDDILADDFRFKDRGFYVLTMKGERSVHG